MKKFLVAAILTLLTYPLGAAENYQDWWIDPSLAGTSLSITQQDETIILEWYLYNESGEPTWLYGIGSLESQQANITLYKSTGPFLGPANQLVNTQVGSAVLSFPSNETATFSYILPGNAGTLNLNRANFAAPPNGLYYGIIRETDSECASSSDDGSYRTPVSVYFAVSNGTLHAEETFLATGEKCIIQGQYQQTGSKITATGKLLCNSGSGQWSANIAQKRKKLLVNYSASIGDFCNKITGTMALKKH